MSEIVLVWIVMLVLSFVFWIALVLTFVRVAW